MGRYSRRPGSGREWVSAETFGDGMAAREARSAANWSLTCTKPHCGTARRIVSVQVSLHPTPVDQDADARRLASVTTLPRARYGAQRRRRVPPRLSSEDAAGKNSCIIASRENGVAPNSRAVPDTPIASCLTPAVVIASRLPGWLSPVADTDHRAPRGTNLIQEDPAIETDA